MQAYVTVADLWRPGARTQALLYDFVVIISGSLLMALGARVAVGWPVPITGQTFAVLLVGVLLGCRRGGLAALVYLAEGGMGLPVFSQGRVGLAALAGPTGGYLVGFVVAASLVGFLAQRGWDRRPASTVLAMICGNLTIYAFGLAWLFCLKHAPANPLGTASILAVGLYPFLVGDLIKILLAAALIPAGWRLLRRFDRRLGGR